MMATVCRVVCVLAAALCCTALCVAAAAAAGEIPHTDAEMPTAEKGVEKRITEKKAEVKKRQGMVDRAVRGALAAGDAQAALQMAKEALTKAKQEVEEAIKNAEADEGMAMSFMDSAKVVEAVVNSLKGRVGQTVSTPTASPAGTKGPSAETVSANLSSITELLPRAKGAKAKAGTVLQNAKDAVLKAEEALKLFGWAEANATDADLYVKDAVGAAKARVTAARTLADTCLLHAERAYNASLAVEKSVTEINTAAQESISVAKTLDKNGNKVEANEKLRDAWKKARKAHKDIFLSLSLFRDVQHFGVDAAETSVKEISSIFAQLESATSTLKQSGTSRLRADAALKEVMRALEQLQGEAQKLGLPDGKQIEEKQSKHDAEKKEKSHPSATDAIPAHAPAPNNNNVADGNSLLALKNDGSSSSATRLCQPLMLLLMAYVALW
ncbi:hypothetical protein DQ04_17791000 [Trypanosoma grayi]|uniref:hypothetical protein n=1 Tax=Trypanosoma grayi TaxID=71804 RepID=UPI0004F49B2E|nr:hypothetical protein DQ04_17791000 [Trypanosoma grayi]KEG05860.1 hypothetical protein DQ04_17791000 [Trypanosoma grayi]